MKRKKPVAPAPEELRAEAAVNEILGTWRDGHDDQTENGMVDFLLEPAVDGAGPKVALEVSSTIDPDRQNLWAGLDRQYDHPVPGLQGDWIVEFTPQAQLKKISGPLAALLLRQEQANLDTIGLNGWDDSTPDGQLPTPPHAADLQELAQLQVVRALRIRSDKASGRILPTELNFAVASSTVDTISPYVDAFLASKGENKVKKLARHPDREGHLFLWADPAHLDITMSLSRGFVPTDSPNVPAEVHTIWLGSFHVDQAVFRWTRSGWSILEVTSWSGQV
ncbi:hypothetical protein ABT288_33970 [Streptomyces sp. NPDC001093]|uniref:hypothetical protein n=1 Tax=unclassified Streptomyces TaxID=2593676 RepID=UPI00331A73F0